MSQSERTDETPRAKDRPPADERVPGGDAGAPHTAGAFDIRTLIAALIGLYGVILLVAGIVGSSESKNKAAGVNINLWAGLGMLALGTVFLVWAFTRPLGRQLREEERASKQSG
jgi:hypothetical protein